MTDTAPGMAAKRSGPLLTQRCVMRWLPANCVPLAEQDGLTPALRQRYMSQPATRNY